MPFEDRRRLLVLSDLHLGRNCNSITGFDGAVRPDQEFDRALIDLFDFYTEAREGEWRVVFAGDFIDFIEVVVVPEKEGRWSFDVTEEEREFGLGNEAERVLVKLEMSMEYHRALFARVAQFVRAGGEIVFLRGNHDAELFWSKVQRVFRRQLAALAFRGSDLDLDHVLEEHTSFQERIRIEDWFYYEAGRVYVEHGHQYDVYCSFDLQLYPVSPSHPRRLDTPPFAFAMRYFVNLMTDFSAHNADLWTVQDYVDWMRQKGVGGAIYTSKMAIRTAWRMILYAVRASAGRVRKYQQEHQRALVELAKRVGVAPDTLKAIDALRHVPVTRNLPELLRILFLDRALLVAGSLFLVFVALLLVRGIWWQLLGIALVAAAAFFVNLKLRPRRYLLPGPKQAQVASRIADLMRVPLVVMGHSHVRMEIDLSNGARYVNTGCWLPPLDHEKMHTDPETPCTCRLSHLVVEDDDVAELRVFCQAAKTVRLTDLEAAVSQLPSPVTRDLPRT